MFGLGSRGSLGLLAVAVVVLCAGKVADGREFHNLASFDESSVFVPLRDDEVSLRLPNDTIPIHYDVSLTTRIHSQEFTYNGHVEITIKCLVATSTIVLHSHVSQITLITLKSGTVETELRNFLTDDEDTEFLTIQLDSPLVAEQEYILYIAFTGDHSEENLGWFRASYTNDNGEEMYGLNLMFKSTQSG